MVVPVFVREFCGYGELAGGEGCVYFFGGGGEFVQDPQFGEGFIACFAGLLRWREVLAKSAEDEFGRLVNLIAESTIVVDMIDVEVDVFTIC